MPVLKTRLYKPVIKPHYVIRKNILDYLDKHADNPLNLVVAAAGYGKSVTISQWLDRKGSKYGWLSLDKDCNDLRVFLDYLTTCLQLTFPESLKSTQTFSNVIDLPPVRVISDFFINEIMELDEEFVLVLDDYHLINNQQIHALISEILRYPSQKLKLFVLSRKDPPLMLSALKAYDHINEVRMSDLRFDESELIELSKKISVQPLKHEIAANLLKVTEGWIIALKLAIQSINQGRDPEVILSEISSEKQTLTKFLMDEILKPQSENVRDCLFRASILSRFCEGLFMSLCANEESQINPTAGPDPGLFSEITSKTLFIIPLDAEQTWFRFHHLFSEILQNQLEKSYMPDQISALHAKASRWLESNGFFDEAMQHALNAGDVEFANQILENQLKELIDNEELPLMDRWLKIMPLEARENHIAPNLIHAFLCDAKADYVSMENSLNLAYKILGALSIKDPQNKKKWGYFYSLQSILFYLTGRTAECLSSSTQALELLYPENSFFKDAALTYHAFSLIAAGKWEEADKKVNGYRDLIHSNDHLGLARNSIILSMISFLSGDLPRIYKTLYPIIDFYKGKSFRTTRGMANYYLGMTYYQWNRLDEAIPWLDDTWENRFSGRPFWVLHNLFIKAQVLYWKKEKSELTRLFEQAHQYADELELPFLHQFISSMEVEIALRDHDFIRAEQLHQKAIYDFVVPLFFYFIPQLTVIKFRLAEGGEENLGKADSELIKLIEFGRSTNNKILLIQALTLQALLLRILGNIQKAQTSFSEALNIAKPGGFIRIFKDLGEEVRDLILLHKNNNTGDPYVNRLLEVFTLEQPEKNHVSDQKKIIIKSPSMLNRANLSGKEIEILKLVAIGFQNKEIADKLFLSPNSVKKYLYEIYQKLEVKNRTNAINKARQLNLL